MVFAGGCATPGIRGEGKEGKEGGKRRGTRTVLSMVSKSDVCDVCGSANTNVHRYRITISNFWGILSGSQGRE